MLLRIQSFVVVLSVITCTSAYCQEAKKTAEEPASPPNIVLENDCVTYIISPDGKNLSFVDKRSGKDYCAEKPRCTFVSLKKSGKHYAPSSCSIADGKITVEFKEPGVIVVVNVATKKHYFVFKVASVSDPDVDEMLLLNLAVASCKYVNNMSGVACDDDFAACVRALNLQANPSVGGNPAVLRSTCCRKYGLVGAKAVLVGCLAAEVRPVLKEVIHNEGLPYSPLGGPWALDTPENQGSYLFARVSEDNVEQWIALAKKAGIMYIHFNGWYKSRGHYQPRKDLFPHGLDGVKAAVDKIHAAGLKAGMHTLTGCISPGDPFTTPVPDKRLKKDRLFTLAQAVNETDNVIPLLESPHGLHTIWAYASRGNVVQIGDELVQYAGLCEEPPYALMKCKRGAFGTKAQSHKKDATVSHLYVRYSFQPDENSTLVDDVADCIAKVVNECGFDLIYHDGAEGMPARHYGASKMRTAIFNKIKRPIRVESSSSGLHHCWPFHSCVGAWDLPHWGLKRFVDIHCRSNERYRKRSLMPAQLGWWGIFGHTDNYDAERPDELEYLCCKALGHDMSMSFQGLRPSANPSNARQDEYLEMIGRYEKLRLSGYFSESVKARLREPKKEFHLIQSPDGKWQFIPTDYAEHKVTRLGDGSSTWSVNNRFAVQPPSLRIQALYGAAPYDGPESMLLADFGEGQEFNTVKTAGSVTCGLTTTTDQVKAGHSSGCYVAKSDTAERRGAWACVTKEFSPPIDIRKYGAIGVWIHGDGKGELLNFQLTNLPHYWEGGQTCSEHYVTVDFTGWRYVELLLRERDAERHGDYAWPYNPIYGIYRAGLRRQCVTKLAIYYNNLPPGEETKCYLSPIKALPVVKVKLKNPSVAIGCRTVVFPVELESGCYIEFNSPDDCKLCDPDGKVIRNVKPQGETPTLAAGENEVKFTCGGTQGYNLRAAVSVITYGEPLRE